MKSLITRKRSLGLGLAALGLWLAGAAPSHAHINFGLTPDTTGLTYEFKGATNHGGAGSITGSVGAKSWGEPNNPVARRGGHIPATGCSWISVRCTYRVC